MDLQTSKATVVLDLEFWNILPGFWNSVLSVRKAISYHSAKSMTKTKTREKEVFTNIVILFHHKNYPLTQNFWQKDFGHSFEKYILCMVNLTQTPPQTLPRYPPDISQKLSENMYFVCSQQCTVLLGAHKVHCTVQSQGEPWAWQRRGRRRRRRTRLAVF